MPFINLDTATATAVTAPTGVGVPLTSVGKTLAELQEELKLALGSREDIPPARLTQWLNDAYLDIASNVQTKDLRSTLAFPTVADQPLYKLPPQVLYTTSAGYEDSTTFRFDGGRMLRKIDVETYRKMHDHTSIPTMYFVYGQLLVLYPTPVSAGKGVRIEFRVRPAPLVQPTHSPILQTNWHRAILLRAREFALEDLLELDAAAVAGNAYVRFVRSQLDTEAAEKEGTVAAFRPVRRDQYMRVPRHSITDW